MAEVFRESLTVFMIPSSNNGVFPEEEVITYPISNGSSTVE
jgi:hypothetical protein